MFLIQNPNSQNPNKESLSDSPLSSSLLRLKTFLPSFPLSLFPFYPSFTKFLRVFGFCDFNRRSRFTMSTQDVRGPGDRRGRRRKTDLNLEWNHTPLSENQEPGGSSTQQVPQEVEALLQLAAAPPVVIDVEAIEDDDVVESSPRAFAQAKSNLRRHRRRSIIDVDLEECGGGINCGYNKRRRSSSNQTITNCELYVNLEASDSSMTENTRVPPEPPVAPAFQCPICMSPVVEETSTKCGHIFCNNCIKSAMKVQKKCPTCRKKVTIKELRRVFLPSTG